MIQKLPWYGVSAAGLLMAGGLASVTQAADAAGAPKPIPAPGATAAPVASPKAPITDAEYQMLKNEVEVLKKKLAATTPVGKQSQTEDLLDNKYGPNAKVTAKSKVTIGGLMQVWYYGIQNDGRGFLDTKKLGFQNQGFGSTETVDNDSFRIRRAELRFTGEVSENIKAFVSIDPAREATSYPTFPSNLGSTVSGDGVALFDYSGSVSNNGNPKNEAVRTGTGDASRLLQDAYINFHSFVPHHDFTVGQFKRRLGEEGSRDSALLDFTERAMITQLADLRDLGVQVHGSWFDQRLQYWLGAFDGAGTAFQQRQNRGDDNDAKDFSATILGRPLPTCGNWGTLELGASLMYGHGGESGFHTISPGGVAPTFFGTDGLNRNSTSHSLAYAWASYMPGGPVKGWWMRGEWGQYRDRFAPSEVRIISAAGAATLAGTTGFASVIPNPVVTDPAPFNVKGWNVSTGYRFSESSICDKTSSVLKNFEILFRYDHMQNLFTPDVVYPTRRMDVFGTSVYTAGVNYYIKGHNAKVQANYNWVNEGDGGHDTRWRQVREVRNDNFVVNFQVYW